MRVHVLFFGMLKDLVGKASDTLDLDPGASVGDLLAHYETQIPRLRESLPSLALAVNQEYASAETKLRPNDEVAILPPVSGGHDGSRIASGGGNRRETAHCAIVRGPIQTQEVLPAINRADDAPPLALDCFVPNQPPV